MKLTLTKTLLLSSFFLFAMALFSRCNSTKESNKKTTDTAAKAADELEPKYNVSAKTRQFIVELKEALKQNGQTLAGFAPTDAFIEKYSITQRNGTHYISGMILPAADFKSTSLEKISVEAGPQMGKYRTVQVPLPSFGQLLQTDGIEYFELTEKAYPNQ